MRLEALLDEGYLSADQAAAVSADGNFFLLACPGSGKTRSAAARFARLSSEGTRVAATSYTNVGVEQIGSVLGGDLGHAVPTSCYIGTLHKLILRYVFYPFGHLVMGCKQPPRLMVDDGPWPDITFGKTSIRLPVSHFAFRPDGSVCVRRTKKKFPYDKQRAAEMGKDQALRLKRQFAKFGVASFEDSMYWALKVLEGNKRLATAVASRFQEILIDEAQDTSELQLAVVREIWQTGCLNSLVVVGDTEQSIYAFQGASPTGCEELIDSASLRTLPLTKNYRSSQRICDLAASFCSRDPDEAVGEHAKCAIEPELYFYDPKVPRNVLTAFETRVSELDLDISGCVVLARGGDLVDELNQEVEAVKVAKNPLALGRAVATMQGGGTLNRRQIEAIDRLIGRGAWGQELEELDVSRRRAVRFATMRLFQTVPALEGDLRSWIKAAAKALDIVLFELVDIPRKRGGQVIQSNKDQSRHQTIEFFNPPESALRAETVHGVKGESHDGVLIVVDRLRSKKHGEQSALWSQAIDGEVTADDAEEIRIAFVAMTRARQYCALALPLGTSDDVVRAFSMAGFTLRFEEA